MMVILQVHTIYRGDLLRIVVGPGMTWRDQTFYSNQNGNWWHSRHEAEGYVVEEYGSCISRLGSRGGINVRQTPEQIDALVRGEMP